MNRIINETNLPRIAADKDSIGEIPKVLAEKTIIASWIPRFAGVNCISKERLPMLVRNNASMNGIVFLNTLNCN